MHSFRQATLMCSIRRKSRFVLGFLLLASISTTIPSYAGNIPLSGYRGFNLGTLDPGLLETDYRATGSSIARLHVRFDLKDQQGKPKLTTVDDWLPLLKPAITTLNQQGQVAVVSLHNPTKGRNDGKPAKRGDRINRSKFLDDWTTLSNGLAGVGASHGVHFTGRNRLLGAYQ